MVFVLPVVQAASGGVAAGRDAAVLATVAHLWVSRKHIWV